MFQIYIYKDHKHINYLSNCENFSIVFILFEIRGLQMWNSFKDSHISKL